VTDDLTRHRVAVVVVADVDAATATDASALVEHTLRQALLAAPNLVRRGPLAHRAAPSLRVLVNDRLDDQRDVTFVTVTDVNVALAARYLLLVPGGEPDPLPTEPTEE